VPEDLVAEVLSRLAELGFGEVEEVTTVDERITFALPRDLQKDIRAAAS
jgi:4-hydroxy-3-methylbut-2-enyl diphosphate reductase